MTDDDNFGWNAFSRVFGDCTQLFRKWHVRRACRTKYHFVEANNCKKKYTRHWKLPSAETSIETFEKILVGFLRKYDSICPKCVNYFKNTYVFRLVKWAMKFEYANTDTNMFVESFHNKLKKFYLERMPNKRIDDLINVILEIEADDYWSHKGELFIWMFQKKILIVT